MGIEKKYRGSVSSLVERVKRGESAVECTALNLGLQGIGDSGVSQLCTVLKHFTALEKLELYKNSISSSGVSALCGILPQCKRLTYLNLGVNSIDDIGAKRIAETLKLTKLKELYLSVNNIGFSGMCALFLSVAKSETLTRLSVEGNSGVSAAVSEIADILPHCTTLRRLWLAGVEYPESEEFQQRILSALENCSTDLEVRLDNAGWTRGKKQFARPDRSQLTAIAQHIAARELRSTPRDPLFGDISTSPLFQRVFLDALKRGVYLVYRRRVAFVGDSGVGKTWTAKSLREEKNIEPANEEERIAQRTAAAESTGFCAADITYTDATRPDVDHLDSSNTPVSEEEDVEMEDGDRVPDTPAPSVASRNDSDSAVFHDRVHNFSFPQGLLEELKLDGQNTVCYMTLWDFGGQRTYHSWYQFFFAPGMIPCVVFDLSAIVGNDKDSKSKEVVDAVNRIVEYAQQALHFGGDGCRVLLVGTQVDRIANTPEEREAVVENAFELIYEASPEDLRGRFYDFPCSDRSDIPSSPDDERSICDLDNNNRGRTEMDAGVQMLKAGLIRECVRDRSVAEDAEDGGNGTRSTVDEVRSLLQQNVLPRSWYEFELKLRDHPDWQRRNFCRVKEMWAFSQRVKIGPAEDVEFVAMLTSMAAAGSVVLSKEVRWDSEQLVRADMDSFMNAVVILRPQWLIEVGQRLLPHPYENEVRYGKRLLKELKGLKQATGFSGRLYKHATVFREVLFQIMMRGNTDLESSFEHMIELFEQRLILCPIWPSPLCLDGETPAKPTEEWFVPSMIAFHSEHCVGEYTDVKARSSPHLAISIEFAWLPPGLQLLLVGAILRDMKCCPNFALRTEGSKPIQFSVELPGFGGDVYIDLPHGTGGRTIDVWTEIIAGQDSEKPIGSLMSIVLDSLHTACRRLRVKPLLVDEKAPIERGLLLTKFDVPLIGHTSAHAKLRRVCEGNIPSTPENRATTHLYRSILSAFKRKIHFRDTWLPRPNSETPIRSVANDNAATIGKLTPLERNRLAYDLVQSEEETMWTAAGFLDQDRTVIIAETEGRTLMAYAHRIIERCCYKHPSAIHEAMTNALNGNPT